MTSRKAVTLTGTTDSFAPAQKTGRNPLLASLGVNTNTPVVSNYVPSTGSALGAATPIQFDVTVASSSFTDIVVTLAFGSGQREVVHAGAFGAKYTNGSNSRTVITDGYRYVVLRDNGWPDTPVSLIVRAINSGGNESSTTAVTWTATPDDTPTVSNFNPITGTNLGVSTPIQFDVTDDSGLFRRIIIRAEYNGIDGAEMVHNGSSFSVNYTDGSSRTPITGGYTYVLDYNDGWPTDQVTINVFAIDEDGIESATTSYVWPAGGVPFRLKYRMRAYDTTLARYVYWDSKVVDSTGVHYTGPGPLTQVVVANVVSG